MVQTGFFSSDIRCGFSGALVNLYTLLPFLVIASLSIFTLTIKELIIISTPIVSIMIWDLYPETTAEIPTAFMLIWLFLLLVLSSFFSSVSQMRYMISQVTRASYDSLTNAMTRRGNGGAYFVISYGIITEFTLIITFYRSG